MQAYNQSKAIPLHRLPDTCSSCSLRGMCILNGLEPTELELVEGIVKHRRPLARGKDLYQAGMPFDSIYVVRAGSLKTYTINEEGDAQVTGFHMPGELVGLDALAMNVHASTAQALDTTTVCEIPYERLVELSAAIPTLGRQLLRRMGQAIAGEQAHMQLLGKAGADARLATLLLHFAERFRERGFSAREFNLSMSRADMCNYLGLALETVSRLFTRFREQGLLEVERRHVQIREPHLLARVGIDSDDPDNVAMRA